MTKILSKTAPQSSAENSYLIAALYHFVPLEEIHEWQQKFIHICTKNHLFGTILIAHEGINGTIAGHPSEITEFVTWLYSQPEFKQTHIKYSEDSICPFHRMKVRLKKEIVTMGEPDINPAETKGVYVKPEDWNSLISSPDVLVVDTRNDYEVAIGKFAKAINPKTTSFREFPKWADDFASENQKAKPSKVAMYCTGGIRCEKSTAYMKKLGFEEVYHLQGGILNYFEEVPANQSLWQGECFVFDNRVSVDHELRRGSYQLCHACRHPLSDADLKSNAYHAGISCPHCITKTNSDQRKRFAERQKQIKLANKRGQKHIGASIKK
ncbi:MAG: rhodanese-related sulfurtransferase [Alphaproteobacteria bacterium]|nr:rhodanese-related sulfurtransferase [Alphaproteobacteria bacterium]